MNVAHDFEASDLDGVNGEGFVVMNVESRLSNGCQVLEAEDGETYFSSLTRAREVCSGLRRESGNPMIFVYALAGVKDAAITHNS